MKAAIETQVCTKCGLEKPLSEYYFKKDTNSYRRDCKECAKKRRRTRYHANPEKERAKSKAYYRANPEKGRAYSKAYYRANPEKGRAYVKTWRDANPERWRANCLAWRTANREKIRADHKAWREANREKWQSKDKAWRKANREKCRANTAKRRAAKLQATPAWADLKKIQEIYLNCPPGHQVDHYFPLQSPIMCGLHVESNLQYLPAKANMQKKNNVTLEQQLNG